MSDGTLRDHLEAAERALADAAVRDGHAPSMDAITHILLAKKALDHSTGIANGSSARVQGPTRLVPDRPWHPRNGMTNSVAGGRLA